MTNEAEEKEGNLGILCAKKISSEFMNAHPQPGTVNVLMLPRPGHVSGDT